MSRLLTSRDLAGLRLVEQGARRARPIAAPRPAARGEHSSAVQLLRRLWNWIEQPEKPVPPSRPEPVHFYPQI